MTVSECRAESMALTFDSIIADNGLFYPALNRAVQSVYSLSPTYMTYTLHHSGTRKQAVTYNMRELVLDFYAFAPPAMYGAVEHYITGDGLLTLYADSGSYTVYYEKELPVLGVGDEACELPLPRAGAYIVPTFIAGVILLDDDPEKAAYYQSLYRTYAQDYTRRRRVTPVTYAINRNGW